jgi:hypothetical protein
VVGITDALSMPSIVEPGIALNAAQFNLSQVEVRPRD